jgi:hypothetical protein
MSVFVSASAGASTTLQAQGDVSASRRARSTVGGVLGNASCRLGNIVESLGARFDNKLVAEIDDRHLLLVAVSLVGRETQRERKAAAVAWRGGPSPGKGGQLNGVKGCYTWRQV